jgi:hypothetical protein
VLDRPLIVRGAHAIMEDLRGTCVAHAAPMRRRWSNELGLALAAHVLGIVIAIAASCTRADPPSASAAAASAAPADPSPAEPMATPDGAPVNDARPIVPPDAAPGDANVPLVDATPSPIPPRVIPDAMQVLPRPR